LSNGMFDRPPNHLTTEPIIYWSKIISRKKSMANLLTFMFPFLAHALDLQSEMRPSCWILELVANWISSLPLVKSNE